MIDNKLSQIKSIPTSLIKTVGVGFSISLGNTAPIIGAQNTNTTSSTDNALIDQKINVYRYGNGVTTVSTIIGENLHAQNSGTSIGLVTDLSEATAATITYLSENTFTLKTTEGTLYMIV